MHGVFLSQNLHGISFEILRNGVIPRKHLCLKRKLFGLCFLSFFLGHVTFCFQDDFLEFCGQFLICLFLIPVIILNKLVDHIRLLLEELLEVFFFPDFADWVVSAVFHVLGEHMLLNQSFVPLEVSL